MKTPRELLLKQHAPSESALDGVRLAVVQQLRSNEVLQPDSQEETELGFLGTLWQELFIACRKYWTGLGAAWCVIVLLAVIVHEGEASRSGLTLPQSAVMIQAMRDQQQLRNELLGLEITLQARNETPDPAMRPRSEVTRTYVAV